MSTLSKWLSFIGLSVLVIVILTSDLSALIMEGDIEKLQQLARGNLWGILTLTFLMMFLQNFITIVPLILLITVNVTLFGFGYGYLWSWLSSVLASSLVFLLTRYWLHNWLMSRVNESVRQRVERNGLLYVLACRLIPVMPSSLINMAAGASSIRFGHFVVGTLIGNCLFMLAVAGVNLGVMKAGWEFAVLTVALILVVAMTWIWRRRRYRRDRARHSLQKP